MAQAGIGEEMTRRVCYILSTSRLAYNKIRTPTSVSQMAMQCLAESF
jgi:hypothetical protein